MKISELIAELEKLKEEHGDLPVTFYKHFLDGIYDGDYEVKNALKQNDRIVLKN
jgi:hypothetical protein